MKKLTPVLLVFCLLLSLALTAFLTGAGAQAAPAQAPTPAPTPTPPYPPSIDIPGSTMPLVWGALILVLIIIGSVILAQNSRRRSR